MTEGPFEGGDRQVDAAVRAVGRADRRALADHPSPGQLADYSLGLHAREEEALIQEHLALCAECAEVVLGLMDTSETGEGREVPSRAELEREWERLQAGSAPPAPGSALFPPLPAPALTWGLAASLVVCVGLLVWGLRLRGELAEARGPEAEVVLADLVPEGAVGERGGGEPPRVQLPGAGRLVLLLNLGDLRTFPRYRIEIAGPRGEIVWADDVRRSDVGGFALDLPAEAVTPGIYEVRLYGAGEQGQTRLAIYRFELVAGPPRPAGG
jgi:hypothetical protein